MLKQSTKSWHFSRFDTLSKYLAPLGPRVFAGEKCWSDQQGCRNRLQTSPTTFMWGSKLQKSCERVQERYTGFAKPSQVILLKLCPPIPFTHNIPSCETFRLKRDKQPNLRYSNSFTWKSKPPQEYISLTLQDMLTWKGRRLCNHHMG